MEENYMMHKGTFAKNGHLSSELISFQSSNFLKKYKLLSVNVTETTL